MEGLGKQKIRVASAFPCIKTSTASVARFRTAKPGSWLWMSGRGPRSRVIYLQELASRPSRCRIDMPQRGALCQGLPTCYGSAGLHTKPEP